MGHLRKIVDTGRAIIHESLAFDRGGISRKKAFFLLHVRLWIQIAKQLVADRCLQQASSLAYKTILSLVPTVAVALSLLKAFGAFAGPDSQIVRFVAGMVMPPDKSEVLATQIIHYTSRLSFGAIGGVGMVSLILVAVSLLDTVDGTINDIWRVRRKRPIFLRFATYYAVLTLGPVLLAASIYQSARLQGLLEGDLVGRVHTYGGPVLFTWAALMVSYKLFPNTKVRWVPAMLGALVAAVGFELVKFAFNAFVSEMLSSSYARIYGALALVPLFLVWIYTVWIIVLFGVEYSYTLQNLKRLVRSEKVRAAHTEGQQGAPLPSEHLALRVLVLVARWFDEGQDGATVDDLQSRLRVSSAAVRAVVARLVELGLLRAAALRGEAGEWDHEVLLPARSSHRLDVADVLRSLRCDAAGEGRGAAGEALERWLQGVDTLMEAAQPRTVAELIERDEGDAVPLATASRTEATP